MAEVRRRGNVPIHLVIADTLEASRLEIVLTKDGYDVVSFRSAKQLWDNFKWRRPRYIITDRRFREEFTTLDLCRNVRAQYMLPYVYIHVLGRSGTMDVIEEVLSAGANDYSVKPISPSQLRARVRVGLRWLAYIDSIAGSPATTKS
ncbi:MAG TPA: response regulator [Verrucomicrobiae bacterium]|nr:response regulator [Verrucomicrobiae bacterium]